ncbi:MAG: 50S ribosomal protein L21 [Candidatus Woesebacteria bacterium GW2011_GWA1_39_21]|uniref:Large ribosomal subunit protein bL21 n=1 Tax=Candidatus Woesebacteria bacterium GW2011_GWA1_39_21 TaxID=1618550 RepID=A0A0G0NG53_9BACT|nr:MAG: 50S ribosomal protein L21 [Candidatus Woesebacteria bacterium GW2011_GWA1_39_21]
MKYAVIKISGKQHKVVEGERLLVDKLNEEKIDTLLVRDGDETIIGKPYVSRAKVSFKKEEVVKGKKIDILKYKAKSRYRKHLGFRPQYTPIVIEKISL